MATYFVKQSAIVATPSDSLDGLDAIGFALSAATFTTSTKNLNKTSAFSAYTWQSGDQIYISGGTGVTTGLYEIASRTDDDNIVLAADIGGTDPSDVTSASGPFTTINKGEDTATTAGDEVRICADATYALGGTEQVFASSGDQTAYIKFTGANSRGVVDGTLAVITATGRTFHATTGGYLEWRNLDLQAGSLQCIRVIAVHSQYRIIDCKLHGSTGYAGLNVNSSNTAAMVIGCEIYGNVDGITLTLGYVTAIGCSIHDNTDCGFQTVGNAMNFTLVGCLIYDNAGDGVNANGVAGGPCRIINCTFDRNDGDAIDFGTLVPATAQAVIANNIISNNGGVGRRMNSDHDRGLFANNVYYNNTGGDLDNSESIADRELNSVTGTDPGYTTETDGSEDYSISSTSPAKAAGWPGAMQSGGTGYIDCGALQREEPAGGSTVIINRPRRTM